MLTRKCAIFAEILGLATGILTPGVARADNLIAAVPSAWRVQVYVPDNMIVYYTGSNCTAGALTMPSNASTEDRNRLWATIATAKSTNVAVGIFYETLSGHCYITSYFQTP